jgi:hypothetical protein
VFTKRAGFLGGAVVAVAGLVALWQIFGPVDAGTDAPAERTAVANL